TNLGRPDCTIRRDSRRWDNSGTPRAGHCVISRDITLITSACCNWGLGSHIVDSYALTPVSHGRGHWFDPSTAHHSEQGLRETPEYLPLAFGTVGHLDSRRRRFLSGLRTSPTAALIAKLREERE